MTEYRQNATKEEKLSTLRNDKAVQRQEKDAATFHSFAQAEENQSRAGRFFEQHKSEIMGNYLNRYPKLPADHWTNQAAMVGDEGAYDGDMSTPIVGEVGEQLASLERLAASATASGPLSRDAEAKLPNRLRLRNSLRATQLLGAADDQSRNLTRSRRRHQQRQRVGI